MTTLKVVKNSLNPCEAYPQENATPASSSSDGAPDLGAGVAFGTVAVTSTVIRQGGGWTVGKIGGVGFG